MKPSLASAGRDPKSFRPRKWWMECGGEKGGWKLGLQDSHQHQGREFIQIIGAAFCLWHSLVLDAVASLFKRSVSIQPEERLEPSRNQPRHFSKTLTCCPDKSTMADTTDDVASIRYVRLLLQHDRPFRSEMASIFGCECFFVSICRNWVSQHHSAQRMLSTRSC